MRPLSSPRRLGRERGARDPSAGGVAAYEGTGQRSGHAAGRDGGYGAGGTLARGTYEIALYQWIAGVDPDDSSQFMCRNRPPQGYDQSEYCSPVADAAEDAALHSYDRATRKRAYARVQEQLAKDLPLDFLLWYKNVQPINLDLKGFDPNPVTDTWNVYRWSI